MGLSITKCLRIAEGRTAEIFTWGENKILKLYRDGYQPGAAEREAVRASIAYGTGLNTPAVIDTITVKNRQGIIFERVQGVTMLEVVLANPQKLIPYAHLLAELQADMHTRTVAKLPLQRQQLQRKIQSASGLATEAKAAILTDLDRLQEDNTLCHGDFHPENILLTVEELVIIDWVDATQGSPLVDAARTTLLLRAGELLPSASELGGKKGAEMRHLFYEAYLERYTQIQSISQETVARWELPVAAARLSEAIGSGEKAEFLKIIEAALP